MTIPTARDRLCAAALALGDKLARNHHADAYQESADLEEAAIVYRRVVRQSERKS